jgi:hypothetical protein
VANPLATFDRVLKELGIPPAPRGRARARRFLEQQPQGRHGRHTYRGADFGLEDAETAKRFRFYTEAFGPWR